ncbi:MAG: hypothetical protein ACE5FT_03225 [Candidatus Nanoarchaeia archaeon]
MRWVLIMLILLASCANPDIPTINKTAEEHPEASVVPAVERSLHVRVVEDIIPTPISDFTLTEESLTFTNRRRNTYYAPIDYLHTKEAKDRAFFIVNKGHYVLLDKGSMSFIVEYESIDTRKKEITFRLNRNDDTRITVPYEIILESMRGLISASEGKFKSGGVEVSRGFYGDLSYEEVKEMNPRADWDAYADSKTLGKGVLKIEDMTFPFYVGYKAGNPLSFDMNGDGRIVGERMTVHTRLNKFYEDVKGIQ